MTRSAAAYGRNPLGQLSAEQLERYYEKLKERERARLEQPLPQFTSAQDPAVVRVRLDDPTRSRGCERTGYAHQRCRACGGEAFGDRNLGHRCSVTEVPAPTPTAPVGSESLSNKPAKVGSPAPSDILSVSNRAQQGSLCNVTSSIAIRTRLF